MVLTCFLIKTIDQPQYLYFVSAGNEAPKSQMKDIREISGHFCADISTNHVVSNRNCVRVTSSVL